LLEQGIAAPFSAPNIRMKFAHLLLTFSCAATALAGPAEDYAALTAGVKSIAMGGTAGGVALQGHLAFPLAISTKREVALGAGYLGDTDKGARVVAMAHTSFMDGASDEGKTFLANIAHWAGRSATARVVCLGASTRPWKAAGLSAEAAGADLEAALGKAELAVVHLHSSNLKAAAGALKKFAARGGGLVLASTPWAAPKEQLEAANEILAEAGLAFTGSGPSETSYPVFEKAPSPLWSALNAIDAVVAFRRGTAKLELADQQLCAATLDAVIVGKNLAPKLATALDELSKTSGWIEVSKATPLRKTNKPIEAALARYQARLLNTLPPEQVPAHPSAKDFPGVVGDGPAVTKNIEVDAASGPDKLINHGSKTIVCTGVYARAGTVITVTLPEPATQAGLKVELGVHIDQNWNLNSWHRFPQITRQFALTQPVTKAANAFGGLVNILVPENCKLGKTRVTISGAVEAPAFILGKTTEAEWNARIKNAPGAWGYIETPKWTGFIPREALQQLEHPEAVAKYWQRVVDTADEYLGYAKWRRRGEAMLTDRDITVGYGHSGYPVMMAYAGENGDGPTALVQRGPQRGDWGFLHELGHTFQDSFDSGYTIATHAEVDVNLVPGIAMMLIHDRTAWDNNCHSTFDAKNRTRDMEKWLTQPEAERTWDKACKGSSVAYDFYFTLAESFGWELYKKAFGRLADWLHEPGKDADLDALDKRSPNHKRDRLFLCFCQAAGRNLLPHFEKYGLGRGDFALSPAVIEKVKALPAWSGNQPVASLTGPATLRVKKDAAAGAKLGEFHATDPDSGTRFTFSLPMGNEDGVFEIEKRTGVLKFAKPPAKPAYALTVRVSDSTIPATTKETTVAVTVE
jgi:hypothetical protein